MGRPKIRGRTCPRCGAPYSYIEKREKDGRIYYYAVHYFYGDDGRRHARKCYLGPDTYIYVSKLHKSLVLEGMIEKGRIMDYVRDLEREIDLLPEDFKAADKRRLVEGLRRLEDKVREIREDLELSISEDQEGEGEA